ncbi:hypothetical protein [Nonomuraea lactucae]|uniref:hypothetical protein n=1 Tax=Nonomuraea lactucae TaxID=2249762 RepID=UPI000DE3684D|nr:hypothetical protein [Nonomuraea lactucae]
MALTDNCDLFVAVHETGINRVLGHVIRQRPSLVNYGSPAVVQNPELLCAKVHAHPVVRQRDNPLVSIGPPLPVVLTGGAYQMEYAVQLTRAEVDVSPGTIALPGELNPHLKPQRFAVRTTLCAGLGCPPDEIVDQLPRPQRSPGRRQGDPVRILTSRLTCFCLDLFAIGGVDFIGAAGDQRLLGKLDGLEIVDLAPAELENAVECYLRFVARLGVLPRLSVPVIRFTKDLLGLATAIVEPTPEKPTVPSNPALEDDQIKVFLDLTVTPSSPGGGGGSSPPVIPGTPRPRVRTGAFDVTAAMSEPATRDTFAVVRDTFSFDTSGSADFGPFSVSYAVAAHLEDGTLDLHGDNTMRVSELDVKFDTLRLCFGIDIPEICVGGFCIIPNPFGGCLLRAPRICVFSDDPDIEFCLDIGGLITSEISMTLTPLTKYSVNPSRSPAMNDWDARDAGIPNHWQLYIDPVTLDVDLFDIADIVGDLLEAAVDAAIDTLLGPLPGWAKDLIKALLGPVIDVVRAILDFGDDLEEWLSDLLGVSLGLFDLILTAIADYLAEDHPLFEVEDPLQILPADGALIPVLLPVEFVGTRVTDDEVVVEADIGG